MVLPTSPLLLFLLFSRMYDAKEEKEAAMWPTNAADDEVEGWGFIVMG